MLQNFGYYWTPIVSSHHELKEYYDVLFKFHEIAVIYEDEGLHYEWHFVYGIAHHLQEALRISLTLPYFDVLQIFEVLSIVRLKKMLSFSTHSPECLYFPNRLLDFLLFLQLFSFLLFLPKKFRFGITLLAKLSVHNILNIYQITSQIIRTENKQKSENRVMRK